MRGKGGTKTLRENRWELTGMGDKHYAQNVCDTNDLSSIHPIPNVTAKMMTQI